jgi:hypothetical protein
MGDYNRSTRECTFSQLRPELVSAIREQVEKQELGDIEAEILACCETTSEKKKKKRGLFGSLLGGDPDPVHYTGVIVTPTWLIWARSGAKSGTVVAWARLRDIQVKDFESELIDDTGLEVFGFIGRSRERGQAFIGLGPESAAKRFGDAVKSAVAQASQ